MGVLWVFIFPDLCTVVQTAEVLQHPIVLGEVYCSVQTVKI